MREWVCGSAMQRSSFGSVIHIDLAMPLDRPPSNRPPTINSLQFLVSTQQSF